MSNYFLNLTKGVKHLSILICIDLLHTFGVMDIFIILIMVMVSWVSTHVKTQIVYFKCVIYGMSFRPQ